MKFVLFCEGHTERGVLGPLLRRWLEPRTSERVGFKPVLFNGWKQLVDDTPKKAALHLRDQDILGVISLLDLYGPTFYPPKCVTVDQRRDWGMNDMMSRVNHDRYRHHFAVHEVEAWLLSQPDLLPAQVRNKLPGKVERPESVNFDEPPAKLLNRLYNEALRKDYKKVVEGTKLFSKLDPTIVYAKCPAFKALADDLLCLCPAEIRRPC